MKNIVFLLCLIFIAFSEPAFAQNQASSSTAKDTLAIKLQGRNQVFIIAKSLQSLTKYQRADSLKTYFFADLEKMLASNNFPETPKRVHYFINQQGKRRLKAEVAGEIEPAFDLEFEKKRMLLDLPPLHYTIYDLPQNLEINYYLEDTPAVAMATNTSLNAALQELKKDRKNLSGLSSYHLERNGFGFEKRNPKRKSTLYIEGLSNCGAIILGNQLSPLIGLELFLTPPQWQGTGNNYFRLGFAYHGFVLTNFADGQFKSINPGSFWQGILQSNFGQDKNEWFGISAGQLSNRDANGLSGKPLIFGIITHANRNSFSFDFAYLDKKNVFKTEQKRHLYMLSYRRNIF